MKAKKQYPFWKRWSTWALVVVACVLGVFLQLEYQSEIRQPSDKWSMAVEVSENLTLNHRAMDVVSNNPQQLIFGQIKEQLLELLFINSQGYVTTSGYVSLPVSNCKVLKLSAGEPSYAYYGNHEGLWRSEFKLGPEGALSFSAAKQLSDRAEYFDLAGDWRVEGNDDGVRLYYEDQEVASASGYENLRSLSALQSEDGKTCYFTLDANSGSTLYRFQADTGLMAWSLGDAQDIREYGMVRDMLLRNNQLTLATHRYNHLEPSEPTVIGIKHFDVRTMSQTGVYYYYHVGTSLEPQLVMTEGHTVSYVLGMYQTESLTGELSRYPQTESGKIVNISRLTREGDTVKSKERLTATREYPVFYKMLELEETDVLLWVDRRAGAGLLRMAGASEPWQALARSRVEVPWFELFVSVLMGMGNSLVIGLLYAAIMLMDAKLLIGVGAILLMLFYKLAPIERKRRGQLVFWVAVSLWIIVKWYVYGYKAEDFKYFAIMYPSFFGSSTVLQLFQLATSAVALGIYGLWRKQYVYYKDLRIHFSVYFGIEVALLLMTTIAFFMNAMMKVKFMM